MKKGRILLIVLLLLLCLCGCNKKEEKEESDLDILNEFEKTLNISDTLTSDLDLKDTYTYKDKEIKASFVSSDTRILSNSGKYYLSLEDDIITLTASFSLNEETLNKTYDLMINKSDIETITDKAYEELNIPSETDKNLDLSTSYKYGKVTFVVSYNSSNSEVIKNTGEICLNKEDKTASLNITLKCASKNYEKSYTKDIKVLAINQNQIISLLKALNYNNEYEEDIELINTIDYNGIILDVTYSSSNLNLLTNEGKIKPQNTKQNVNLTATCLEIEYTFSIDILPMSDELCLTKAMDEVYVPKKVTSNIILPTSYSYGVSATWKSSDESLLSNDGTISNKINSYTTIKLTLTLSKGETTMNNEYSVVLGNESHMYLDKSFEGSLTNLEIVNGKMVLSGSNLTGTYIGKEIEVDKFTECVASYAATSSENATCELQIRIKSNNTWSKYFSYGEWGQGLKNASYNQTDTYFKMDTDEIMAVGSNQGDAFQLKLIVKRTSADVESPKVSLLACTIQYVNYTYNVDISSLPKDVKYDVPKLYQGAVPGIGGSICSATTSTMLLKYKGHDFTNNGTYNYEHEYIAYIVRDYGHEIFGNWVYNTIGIGSFGELSYVMRCYSLDELIYHLATVGPVGCSVKGYVINGVKDYNTAGHLIVVTGYRINSDGSKTMYINDPNVPSVSVEMTETNFMNINRNVYYSVE